MKWLKWLILLLLVFSTNVSYAHETAQPIFKVHLQSHQKIIALTFDDGPDPYNTPKLLDVLRKGSVKATFFVLGKRANKYPTLLKRIAREGHEIGNHGYSHRQFRKLTPRELSWEIRNTDHIIIKSVGKKPHSFRSPYGEVTSAIENVASQVGYNFIEWSIDPRDWEKGQTAQRIQRAVESHLHTGGIVLLHDGGGNRQETVKAVRALIRELKKKGYVFATITELTNMNK
jgi:peptidoglycan-N-acetylglucosamine deacetylase